MDEQQRSVRLDHDIRDALAEICLIDDKNEFVLKMQALSPRYGLGCGEQSNFCRPEIFQLVCEYSAVNCARALLEGETDWQVDLNAPLNPKDPGFFPLHYAAINYDYVFTELFIRHGARTDVRTCGVHVRNGLLSLNLALEFLCSHWYLVDWGPKESIFKLITILCSPQMKGPLEVCRLLAQNTKETFEVLCDYAREGKLIEMAALLMVAREKVMAPVPFQSIDGSTLDGTASIRQCINKVIFSQIEEEIKRLAAGRSTKWVNVCKKLISALLLLEVFEKAGDAIEAYLQSERSNVSKDKVVEDVKSLLVKAGFALKDKDIDLSNITWVLYDPKAYNINLASGGHEAPTLSSQPHDLDMPLHSHQGSFPNAIKPSFDRYERHWVFSTFFPLALPIAFCASSDMRKMSRTYCRTSVLGERSRSMENFSKARPRTLEQRSKARPRASGQRPRHLHPCKQFASLASAIKRVARR